MGLLGTNFSRARFLHDTDGKDPPQIHRIETLDVTGFIPTMVRGALVRACVEYRVLSIRTNVAQQLNPFKTTLFRATINLTGTCS